MLLVVNESADDFCYRLAAEDIMSLSMLDLAADAAHSDADDDDDDDDGFIEEFMRTPRSLGSDRDLDMITPELGSTHGDQLTPRSGARAEQKSFLQNIRDLSLRDGNTDANLIARSPGALPFSFQLRLPGESSCHELPATPPPSDPTAASPGSTLLCTLSSDGHCAAIDHSNDARRV